MEIQSVNTTGEYEIQTVSNLEECVEENVEENNTGVPLEIEDPLNTFLNPINLTVIELPYDTDFMSSK